MAEQDRKQQQDDDTAVAGSPTIVPALSAQQEQPQTPIAQMRAAGRTTDQIAEYMNSRREEAKQAGFSDEEIDEGIAQLASEDQTPKATPMPGYRNQGDLMMEALTDPWLRAHPHAQDAALRQINEIARARHLQEQDSASTYGVWAQDNIAEAENTGKISRPIPPADLVQHLGPDGYQKYQATVQLAEDKFRLASMSPDDTAQLLNQYQPQPGVPGYANAIARRSVLVKAAQALQKEKEADPAGYAMNHLAAVQHDFQQMAKMAADVTASQGDKRFFANKFAETMIAEQRRVGIDDPKILPKDLLGNIVKHLNHVEDDGGAVNIVKDIKMQADLWGNYWPMVYRDVGKEAGPLFRVLGAGNTPPHAAALLAQNAKLDAKAIMKDQDEDTIKNVHEATIRAFRPFAQTVVSPDRSQVVDDFISQGEKLTALYVSQGGMRTSAAADAAYRQLVGDAYDFSGGTYRVPKVFIDDQGVKHTLDPVAIANGVAAAQTMIGTGKLAVAPKFDAGPDDTESSLRAYGRWITNHNETGLVLTQQDGSIVRGPSNKSISLTWQELADLGKGWRQQVPPGGNLTP